MAGITSIQHSIVMVDDREVLEVTGTSVDLPHPNGRCTRSIDEDGEVTEEPALFPFVVHADPALIEGLDAAMAHPVLVELVETQIRDWLAAEQAS